MFGWLVNVGYDDFCRRMGDCVEFVSFLLWIVVLVKMYIYVFICLGSKINCELLYF